MSHDVPHTFIARTIQGKRTDLEVRNLGRIFISVPFFRSIVVSIYPHSS